MVNLIHLLQLKNETDNTIDASTLIRLESSAIYSAENLLSSMEDMLLWGKGQMNNFEPEMKAVAIEEMFIYIENYFEGEKEVFFKFENGENLKFISDENILKTVLRNLTSNAIKALVRIENPTIVWKAWQLNEIIYLSITDNGPGISKEHLKALYDESEVMSVKNGLGLHLIRDLSVLINCKVDLENSTTEGTTFCLKFNE